MKIDYYNEIKLRYGNVRRAKGFYIYTEKNVRLLDLYLDGGMSILGRRMNQSPLLMKQFIDKGLSCFLPTQADNNLKKVLNQLFPEHSEFRLYSSDFDCIQALNIIEHGKVDPLSLDLNPDSLQNGLVHEYTKKLQSNLWRPFLTENDSLFDKSAFFVQSPLCSSFKILVFKVGLADKFPASALMSASEKVALARAFFDLAKKQAFYNKTKNFTDGEYLRAVSSKRQRLQAESSLNQYNKVKALASEFWNFKSSYLFPKIDEDSYEDLFFKALDAHILISPDFSVPSFLPRLENYTELLNFLNT